MTFNSVVPRRIALLTLLLTTVLATAQDFKNAVMRIEDNAGVPQLRLLLGSSDCRNPGAELRISTPLEALYRPETREFALGKTVEVLHGINGEAVFWYGDFGAPARSARVSVTEAKGSKVRGMYEAVDNVGAVHKGAFVAKRCWQTNAAPYMYGYVSPTCGSLSGAVQVVLSAKRISCNAKGNKSSYLSFLIDGGVPAQPQTWWLGPPSNLDAVRCEKEQSTCYHPLSGTVSLDRLDDKEGASGHYDLLFPDGRHSGQFHVPHCVPHPVIICE